MSSVNNEIIHTEDESEENTFSSRVFQCVAYITHKCPILQELFLKWTTLSSKEKVLLNYIAFHVIEKNQIDSYAPIIQGFGYWNNIQDVEGASGFHENPLDFKFDKEDEKKLFEIILIIDKIVSNILIRPHLSKEIKNFKTKKLRSLKQECCHGWGDNL